MTTDLVLIERNGAVATLTLNCPGKGNSIDLPMAQALLDAAILCDEDAGIRCVVLTGAGRMFCVGGDVSSFAAAGDGLPALITQLTAVLHAAVSRLARMNKPLLTLINGPAAGAGLSLAALGDIALASTAAHFTMAYTAIGLSPDGGSTWLLPRLIGLRRTQELALTNRRLSADDAAAVGLVTRVVEAEALTAEGQALATTLAAGATGAFGRTRALLTGTFAATLEDQMAAETVAITESGRSAQGREGIAAFMEKRKPAF
jgi:2-(1,2-epoxy-1,2-dihydrophenyl)acetyl-CoA isomerase